MNRDALRNRLMADDHLTLRQADSLIADWALERTDLTGAYEEIVARLDAEPPPLPVGSGATRPGLVFEDKPPRQKTLMEAAKAFLKIYLEENPPLMEAIKAQQVLTGEGVRFMYYDDRAGYYIVRDDTDTDILTVDLRSWTARRE